MPESYTQWRPKQEEGLRWLDASTKRMKVLCAPTGSGKTELAMGYTLRNFLKDPRRGAACFVTDSRALQDIYIKRYASIGMVDIRGRDNYKCELHPDDPDYSCEQGFHARCPFKGRSECPASQAENRAASSRLITTNYSKWIHARKFSHGLKHVTDVVFDEAHEMYHALSRALQITLGANEVEEVLGLSFPDPHEAQFFRTWRPWAQEAVGIAQTLMLAARRRVMDSPDPKPVWVKHLTHLKNLCRKLLILSCAATDNWIVDELPKGYQFDAVQPGRYVEPYLLLKVPNILCMSATIRPKTLYMTGIAKDKFDFTEFQSDFDPARCPIYYTPTMKVDGKNNDRSMLWLKMDQIASPRRDRNGLVHTISYARRDEAMANSCHSAKMFFNEKGEPPTAMIEEFVSRYPGAILVSPAIAQGYDFAGKRAEWQFICKIPFQPRTRINEARAEHDPEYPFYQAIQKLEQICGRLMRSHQDQGETFIGDDHLKWFLPQYGHLASKSFNQFFRTIDALPPPPPRLV